MKRTITITRNRMGRVHIGIADGDWRLLRAHLYRLAGDEAACQAVVGHHPSALALEKFAAAVQKFELQEVAA